jgi:formate dehydrogenase iron-sulfur subunit
MAAAPAQEVGFFTDSSICIGCKACEVACKEWNNVPVEGLHFLGTSYDNTGTLGANTWRHVAFVEQGGHDGATDVRWLMNSDVCKHCSEAGCLDVCPTGAIFRSEFGSVVVQADVCNGCGYCIPACPFGVIGRRDRFEERTDHGLAHKCTLCYDRLKGGLEPACAQACPTKSIQFGPLPELRSRAKARLDRLHEEGQTSAQLYLASQEDNGVGGAHAFFLLMDRPSAYRFPERPVVATRRLGEMWKSAAAAMAVLAVGSAAAMAGERR